MTKVPATLDEKAPDGSPIYRPRVRVTVNHGKKAFAYDAIVDSGADNSVISAELIASVGAKWEKLTDPRSELGAGGIFETRRCQTSIYYDGTLICDHLRVAEPGKMPAGMQFLILGRSDFFTKYVTSFHWDEDPPWFEVVRVT